MSIKAVEVRAELRQVKTMADYTINLTLNLPDDCREQAKQLLDWLAMKSRSLSSTRRSRGYANVSV